MRVPTFVIMLLLGFSSVAAASAGPGDKPTRAAVQYQALLDDFEQEGGARAFAERFLKHAETHANDSTAVDALLWIVENVRGRADATRALELLREHHIESQKLATACVNIGRSRSVAAEPLLRALLEKSPHHHVRARACYSLALLLDLEASIMDQLSKQPELAPRVLQYYGKEYGEHLSSLEPQQLLGHREQVYERMRKSFSGDDIQGVTMGSIAEQALFGIRYLSVGRLAPEIQGEDVSGEEFKLSDYRGKVVMLTFWGHW